MRMIETPDISKQIQTNSHSALRVKYSEVKSANNIF